MSTVVGWDEIAVRLILTIVGGALIGLDRGEHGRPAGLRTTILVALAAAASMVQVNLLLGLAGKAHDSFIVMDLMRLPLGILSGMGFIGGGAILRRGKMITLPPRPHCGSSRSWDYVLAVDSYSWAWRCSAPACSCCRA